MNIDAAVLRSRDGDIAIEELALADPGPGEVLVRVVASGMCHTDLLPRQEGFFARPPLVLGHEGAGVIEAVGEQVADLQVGDHVIMSYASCGGCASCRRGEPYNCVRFFAVNMTGRDAVGGSGPMSGVDDDGLRSAWFGQSSFATRTVVAAANAVRVDSDVPLDVLAPLGCGFQTGAGAVLNVLDPRPGATIGVVGVGAVGLAAVMAARAADAAAVVAVDRQASRLTAAADLGATGCVDTSVADLGDGLRESVPDGVDAIIDTTGVPTVIEACIDAVRPGGTVVLLGTSMRPVTIAPGALAMGKSLVGVLEGGGVPREFLPRLIDLWRAGRFPVDRIVSHYRLADVATAERDLREGRVIKPVLLP